jgi:hypothetical protein
MNPTLATRNPKNAYTDAPELHPNLILGSLQLLFWLFFHPSAWRNHVARIDPALRPDFCLAELSRTQWRNPALRRLLMMVYIVWPLLVGLLVALVLWVMGGPGEEIAYAVAYGVAFSVVFGVAVGLAVGVAGGLAGGVVGGAASGVAGGVAFGVAGGVAFGVAGGVALGVAVGWHRGLAVRVAFGVAVGVAVGVAFGVAFNLAVSLVFGAAGSAAGGVAVGVAGSVAYGGAYGLVFGVAVGMAVGWRTQKWRRGVAVGLTLGVALGVTVSVADSMAVGLAVGVAGNAAASAAQSAYFSALFALHYVLAERIAGPQAGAVTGAMVGVVNFALDNPLSPLPISILLALTLAWWRPVLLYPFLTTWNLLLYHADERHSGGRPSLLRWHSAFWDEFQRLPLLGLEQHLILVAARNPVEGQAAIEYLATSHQRWAAQKVQSELGARQVGKEMPR